MSITSILISRQAVAILFIAGSLFSAGVSFLAGRQWRRPIWRYLALLMLANAVWAWGDALEILTRTPSVKQFWYVFSYFGRVSEPPLLLTFALYFAHQEEERLRSKWWALLWLPGLIALVLAATNAWHHLIWTEITINPVTLDATYSHGAYFYFVTYYTYILLTIAIIVFMMAVWHLRVVHRRQVPVMTVAVVIPVMTNILYFTPLNPLTGVDQTALAFGVTGALLLWSITRLKLIDLRPIRREVLIEHMTEGVLVLNPSSHVLDFNPAAAALSRVTGQLIGRLVSDAFPEITATLQACDPYQICRTELILGSAPRRHLDLVVTPLRDISGAYRGRLVIWRDITTLRQAETQGIQDEYIKTTQQITQQLHDNLGDILGYLGMDAAVVHNLIERGEYAAALARVDALRLAAQEANLDTLHLNLKQQVFEIGTPDFTSAITQYLRRFEAISGLQIQISLPEERLDVLLPNPMLMSLLQILQNALTHIHQETEASLVQVILTQTPQTIQLIITDNGKSLDSEAPTRPKDLFLATMRQHAADADAIIQFRGTPGQGNQIVVTFPRPEPNLIQEQLQGWKVLLVDDHPLFLEGLQDVLQSRGMQVVAVARDGEEGVRLANELKPNLVLMDVRMPRLAGPEAARLIKISLPKTRVVMLTMSTDERGMMDSLAGGADGYLLKTQPTEDIFQALAALSAGQMPLAPEVAEMLALRMVQTPDRTPSAEHTLHTAGLSVVQVEVLRRLGQGMYYKQVAADLRLSESAIKYHVERILILLNLPSRAEAISYARQIGLMPPIEHP